MDKTLLYMFMMGDKTSTGKEVKESLVSLFTQDDQKVNKEDLDPTLLNVFLAMNKK